MSISGGGLSNSCVGICISSIQPIRCRFADSTALHSSNGSAAGWPGASRSCGCGSPAELVSIIRSLNRAIGELDQELQERNAKVAPGLLELPGCAAVTAAKLLAEIGPIDRFKSDAQFARHSGVAPLEASSGRTQRHRLDRGGNRQLNAARYRIAITQARYHPDARAYLERKRSEGKSRREALRCLNGSSSASSSTPSRRAPP